MSPKFRIRLKEIHEKSGLSAYAVAKTTGLSQTTVHKYVGSDEVITDRLEKPAITLVLFYGADWRDPKIVDLIEGEESPETKTPLLASA